MKPCVNHKNSKANDNRASNLEWVTYRENTEHGLREGTINQKRKGVSCVRLDPLQKSAVICLLGGRFSQRQISCLLEIPETTINSLIRREIKK
jgi:hypothetical protein